MIDAYDIYQEVLGQVNKEENGYLPADLFNTYARAANRVVFNDYVTRLQNPQVAPMEKGKLEDRLSPFEMYAVQNATKGIFTVPADSAYFKGAKIKGDGGASAPKLFALTALLCEADEDPTINVAKILKEIEELAHAEGMQGVELLDHDQVAKRLNSYVPGKKPSFHKPIMERTTTLVAGVTTRAFQVYPATDMSVFLNYYRRPVLPKLVMTATLGTLPVYALPPVSIGFEWEEEAMSDVVKDIVNSFATYIREGGLFQMNNAQKQQ